jgi:hypothetical protein
MSNGTTGTGPDPATTTDEASSWFQVFLSFLQAPNGAGGIPGFLATHAAAMKAIEHVKIPSMVAKVVGTILGMMAEIVAGALTGIEAAKQEGGSGFNDLIAASIEDLLNVRVVLNTGASGGPAMDSYGTGSAVFDAFKTVLGGFAPIDPGAGDQNARSFLGMGVNFAVVTSFLGIIGGLFPFIHLDEIKSIGEELRSTLGLGRLTHTALTPLANDLVAVPLRYWLNAATRPTRLKEAQLVKALHSGTMDDATVRQELAYLGYSDDLIDFILTDFAAKLALAEQILLLDNGDITEQDVINNLTLTGMPEDQAKQQLAAARYAGEKTQWSAVLSEVETSYVNGFASQALYNSMLDKIPFASGELDVFRQKVGFKQEVPRKRASLAEVQAAVIAGISDFSYFDTWLALEGYDTDSQNILSFQMMQKLTTAEHKAEYAQYKAAALKKAGKPVPPWITNAEKVGQS